MQHAVRLSNFPIYLTLNVVAFLDFVVVDDVDDVVDDDEGSVNVVVIHPPQLDDDDAPVAVAVDKDDEQDHDVGLLRLVIERHLSFETVLIMAFSMISFVSISLWKDPILHGWMDYRTDPSNGRN